MPLVRIDHSDSRPNASGLAAAIHQAIVSVYRIPSRDRFQVITARPQTTILADDAGLGFERTDPVIVQIFTQRGRSPELKQQLYAEITHRLSTVGVDPADLFISYIENGPEDWSFGFGRAQYVTGELAVP